MKATGVTPRICQQLHAASKFPTLQLAVLIILICQIDANCGDLIHATTAEQLPKLLLDRGVTEVFLDLDETLVMPDTPFIFGMPGSDRFIEELDPCLMAALPKLAARMEASYYAASLQLVDFAFPRIIAEMKRDVRVVALTSRHTGANADYEAHNFQVIDFLAAAGVQLSLTGAGNDTAIGSVVFAQGEKVNKGHIIKDLLRNPGSKAALVDNTLGKLEAALAVSDLCLVGVHLTAAFDLEQSDMSRKQWICKELGTEGECSSCHVEL